MTNPVYRDPKWKAVRRFVLDRDDRLCQLRLPGCTTVATEVDHTIDLGDGGAPFDPGNCQASCKSCNIAKRNAGVAARAREQRNPKPPTMWDEAIAKYGFENIHDPTKLSREDRIKLLGWDW